MVIIGVIGRKGGSGKTTIAVNLAAAFAAKGRRVALVDADLQGSSTYWAEPGDLPVPVVHHPLEHAREITAWSRTVRDIDAELVVLDAPPHLNEALGGIIGLSDLCLIPCGPSGLDLIATGEAVGLVRQVRDERGDGKPLSLLVPNRVDRRTTSGRELAAALKDLGEPVGPAIGARMAFVDAFNAGQWVGDYAPRSPAAQELQALTKRVQTILRKVT